MPSTGIANLIYFLLHLPLFFNISFTKYQFTAHYSHAHPFTSHSHLCKTHIICTMSNCFKNPYNNVRFSPVWQRLYFLFGCHGLLLPVMLLFDVASPYISSIMRGDASLAGRSAVSHDGSWIRVAQGDSERSPASENQF